MTNQRTAAPLMMLIFGLAAGAVGALLLAPRSGRETREKMKVAGKKMQDKALLKSDEMTDKLKLSIRKTSDKLNSKADEAVDKINTVQASTKRKVAEMDNASSVDA